MDELLKSLLRRTADLMFFLDSNGVILSASDACRGIAGYSITQLNGRSIFELTHPEEREKLGNKFSMVIESNKDISIDFKLKSKFKIILFLRAFFIFLLVELSNSFFKFFFDFFKSK